MMECPVCALATQSMHTHCMSVISEVCVAVRTHMYVVNAAVCSQHAVTGSAAGLLCVGASKACAVSQFRGWCPKWIATHGR